MARVLPFTRDKLRSRRLREVRPRTENTHRLTKDERARERVHLRVLEDDGIDLDALRPRTRGDCVDGPRPCPWVGCQHNLYLDVNEDTQHIKFNFPDLEPNEVPPNQSCALDVADHGGATLEDVARTMNCTRERVRQIEMKVGDKVRRAAKTKGRAAAALLECCDRPGVFNGNVTSGGSVFGGHSEPETTDDPESDDLPARVSFLQDPPTSDDDLLGIRSILRARSDRDVCRCAECVAEGVDPRSPRDDGTATCEDDTRSPAGIDELVGASVWNMFAKASNARGIDCRSKSAIAASRTLARTRAKNGEDRAVKPPTHIEEKTMKTATNGIHDLNDKQKTTLAAYNDIKTKTGRVPMATEVSARTKFSLAATRYQIGQLAELGLAETAPRGGIREGSGRTDAKKSQAKEPKRMRKASVPGKPALVSLSSAKPASAVASDDPFISTLIRMRDDLLTKAAALDTVIANFAQAG